MSNLTPNDIGDGTRDSEQRGWPFTKKLPANPQWTFEEARDACERFYAMYPGLRPLSVSGRLAFGDVTAQSIPDSGESVTGLLLRDWTRDRRGRSNNSSSYLDLVDYVADLIKIDGGRSLDRNWAVSVARRIMSGLAHEKNLGPR